MHNSKLSKAKCSVTITMMNNCKKTVIDKVFHTFKLLGNSVPVPVPVSSLKP
jgi:hypothetical protein